MLATHNRYTHSGHSPTQVEMKTDLKMGDSILISKLATIKPEIIT